ncbi:hypothetical protein TKK_0014507 [Trichogramma kaykai]
MLIEYINVGWPKEKKLIPQSIMPYRAIADELSVIDGLVYKCNKLVVPMKLRNEMLNLIHYNHLGIEKCKARAREILYWSFMNKQIEETIANCHVCNKYKKCKSSEPLMPRSIPNEPWQVVGMDLFHFKDSEHLLIIDYFNNGTQFNDLRIKKFAKDWNFIHETSSPCWAQSNGMVERYVQTIKNMYKKVEEDGKDPCLALLEYRNTPIDKNLKEQLLHKQAEQKAYSDKHAHKPKHIAINDKVFVCKDLHKPLVSAKVIEKCDRPRSYKVQLDDNNNKIERNSIHIYPFKGTEEQCKKAISQVNSKYKYDDCKDNSHKVTEPPKHNLNQQNDCNVDLNNNSPSSNVTTRSGRIVKPPSHLKDYICN